MSTVFEVYPGCKAIPSFSELLYNTEKEANNYLRSININKDIKLAVDIQSIKGHIKQPFQLEDKVVWDDSNYAWFYVSGIPGGTDAYLNQHSDLDIEFLKEELKGNDNFKRFHHIFVNNMRLGYKWSFRRSAGQPAVITLCYGFLAATLAKLTGGVIYTDDGAWDYKRFPSDPDEFLQWYFRLEYLSVDSDVDIDFVQKSLSSLKDMLI